MSQQLILSPGSLPVLSKTNAKAFHEQVRQQIFETGNGLFEYLELINFVESLKKQVNGDSNSKIEPDKELIEYTRDQIRFMSGNDKEPYTSPRGVKFSLAETGTSYDFSQTNDWLLPDLEKQHAELAEKIKARKEFLKSLPTSGLPVLNEDTGEMVSLFPPAKASKSSFKIQLPK